ncbi:hypothetical protein ACHAW6_005466, partial [Cyclotella cf. meneghiniana]
MLKLLHNRNKPNTLPSNKKNLSIAAPKLLPCSAKRIKLEATTQEPIQMFELLLFSGSSGSSNIALAGNASQSSTFNNNDNFAASKAIDGSNITFSHTLPSDLNAWWEVELQVQSVIDSVVIVNRYCGSDPVVPNICLCRLSSAKLTLFDMNGASVAVRFLRDTCSELVVSEDFSSCYSTTRSPSFSPSKNPSKVPSKSPSKRPSVFPSKSPTKSPTKSPIKSPSKLPTKLPTKSPTKLPSKSPTRRPSKSPTNPPTKSPTKSPIKSPTKVPTKLPTAPPTSPPTRPPTRPPTKAPSKAPTKAPSKAPTKSPTNLPSVFLCNAKRIKLEATSQEPIQMFELLSFSGSSNIALAGNASQSSTFNNNDNFAASKAIDG